MRVQAIAKSGGLWMPWHDNLPEGSNIELDVTEVMTNNKEIKNQLNSTEIPPLINNLSSSQPDNSADIQTLDRLLDALFIRQRSSVA